MTPLEQLINFLTSVDRRIALIDKESFLTEMIALATDDAMLLHMHQGLASPCDVEDENAEEAAAKAEEKKKEEENKPVEQGQSSQFNGVYYDVRIKTHYFGTQRQIVFVFTNVSAEKELQREIVMKQYSQIMFASVNHELRTPINGKFLRFHRESQIVWLAGRLLRWLGGSPSERLRLILWGSNECCLLCVTAIQNSLTCMKPYINPFGKMYFEICESSSSFLLSLVNDTLDFAQLQAGKFKMNYEEVDIRAITAEVTNLINVQLRLKTNVFLVKSVATDAPQIIMTDYQRLKQVLINLLRNSTKFTFKGYIQVNVQKAYMKASKKGTILTLVNAVKFEVYDTGIGISDENQASMFKLFGKVMQKNKNINKEGIGLGLYITKNLVEELGGLISVASKEGVFTNFWFVLPLVQDTPLTRRHVEWMQRQGFKVDLPPEPEAGTEQTEAAEPDAEEGVMNLDEVSDVEYEYYEPNEDDEVEKEFLRTV